MPLFRIECVGGGSGIYSFLLRGLEQGVPFPLKFKFFWFIGRRKRDIDFKNAFKNISCSFLLFILWGVKNNQLHAVVFQLQCLLLNKENINSLWVFWVFVTSLLRLIFFTEVQYTSWQIFFLSLNNFFNILNAFQHYILNIFLRHLKSVYKCYISVCHLSVLELVSRVNLIILQCNSCVAGIYRGMLDIEHEMCSIYDSFTWTLEKIPLH